MIFQRLFKMIMKSIRKHEIHYINDIPNVSGNCIYAVNHSCKWDSQYMMEVLPRPLYMLVGKQRLDFIDRFGFIWSGTVWVDRKDKTSKVKSKEKLNKLLQKGKNICIFPEGTWNLTPEKPMLPLYWGVIDLAQKNGVPIIPICLEYRKDICYVKTGDPIYVAEDADKLEEITKLREIFATIRWEQWEMFPQEKRCDVEEDYWEKYVTERLAEYPKLNYEYEKRCIRE